jgi:hypothetical protein
MELYHFTNTDGLYNILMSESLSGDTQHNIGGKSIRGSSLTRNRFFDISNTYAVAGIKSWRLGLDYNKLRNRYKILPIRDEYLRKRPRGVMAKGIYGKISSDEMEEFVIGGITDLTQYITSLAVEDESVDISLHPRDLVDNSEDYEHDDFNIRRQQMLYEITTAISPEMERWTETTSFGGWYSSLDIPAVPFYFIDRHSRREVPLSERVKWLNNSE